MWLPSAAASLTPSSSSPLAVLRGVPACVTTPEALTAPELVSTLVAAAASMSLADPTAARSISDRDSESSKSCCSFATELTDDRKAGRDLEFDTASSTGSDGGATEIGMRPAGGVKPRGATQAGGSDGSAVWHAPVVAAAPPRASVELIAMASSTRTRCEAVSWRGEDGESTGREGGSTTGSDGAREAGRVHPLHAADARKRKAQLGVAAMDLGRQRDQCPVACRARHRCGRRGGPQGA